MKALSQVDVIIRLKRNYKLIYVASKLPSKINVAYINPVFLYKNILEIFQLHYESVVEQKKVEVFPAKSYIYCVVLNFKYL